MWMVREYSSVDTNKIQNVCENWIIWYDRNMWFEPVGLNNENSVGRGWNVYKQCMSQIMYKNVHNIAFSYFIPKVKWMIPIDSSRRNENRAHALLRSFLFYPGLRLPVILAYGCKLYTTMIWGNVKTVSCLKIRMLMVCQWHGPLE